MATQITPADSNNTPDHLEPSELGTQRYWNKYYEDELATLLDREAAEDDFESASTWFDDVKAPQKILNFLVGQQFPLSPCHFLSDSPENCPSVLDLGTGNGRTLLQLRCQGRYRGQLVGVDYSRSSIQVAQELVKNGKNCHDIRFEVMDIIRDDPRKQSWWLKDGFDLVLDKGAFDAVSLCDEIVESSTSRLPATGQTPVRIHTLYPSRALSMVKPGGFLLITSCTWTQEEVVQWFTSFETGSSPEVSIWKTIAYPKFKFGGQEGQAVCTVCFRKDFTLIHPLSVNTEAT